MNQRSEHLSDAQIEQYGKRASGAGPETEAWVETHLDDCPSCRSRVLDFQRTRFALFPDPKVNKVSTSDCSSEDDLRDLAAGLYPDPKAAQLKAHAATCGRCGPLLQEYIEDFSDESSPEEQAFLNQMRTSSPEFREQKARQMFEEEIVKKKPLVPERVSSTDWRRFFSWKWIMVPATAAVVAVTAITVPVYLARRDTPEKVEKILAQAYTEQRTMEMRIPYAKHAELKQTRSGDSLSLLSSPEALRQAAERIAAQLKKNPDDPRWLMLSARLDLLDWRYKPALSTLDKINDGKVVESPEFLMTRALVLYEKGAVEHDPLAYREAVDLTGKALQKTPDDTIALFNQAVVCEKLLLYECSERDYGRLLVVDKDSGWSVEAREHLNRIREKKSPER